MNNWVAKALLGSGLRGRDAESSLPVEGRSPLPPERTGEMS